MTKLYIGLIGIMLLTLNLEKQTTLSPTHSYALFQGCLPIDPTFNMFGFIYLEVQIYGSASIYGLRENIMLRQQLTFLKWS